MKLVQEKRIITYQNTKGNYNRGRWRSATVKIITYQNTKGNYNNKFGIDLTK